MGYALTFDDGPGPSMPRLLDVLAAGSVRATFFILGCNVVEPAWGEAAAARAMVVRAIAAGHEIANHSYSHAHAGAIAPAAFLDEVRGMDVAIRELRREAGADPDARILVRLPYGEEGADDPRAAALRGVGREPVAWTGGLYRDWEARDPIALCEELVAHARDCERRGVTAVLTLHISGESPAIGFERPWTVDAVRLFLTAAERHRWSSVPCPAVV
jgi:peptidoglycan-N-acetylglucosamine deacetylase